MRATPAPRYAEIRGSSFGSVTSMAAARSCTSTTQIHSWLRKPSVMVSITAAGRSCTGQSPTARTSNGGVDPIALPAAAKPASDLARLM
jgi:hypothetical protein